MMGVEPTSENTPKTYLQTYPVWFGSIFSIKTGKSEKIKAS